MKVIILFGPPGSGKGTQSEILAQKLDFIHLSTGALLRSEIVKSTELGKKADSLIHKSQFVPDEIIIEIVKNFLSANLDKNGTILDGFPRNFNQAESFSEICRGLAIHDIKMINLQADDDELTKRLLKRAGIENRTDDNAEVIKNRLGIYNKETLPLIEDYSSNGYLQNVNGLGSVEEVQERIMNVMNARSLISSA